MSSFNFTPTSKLSASEKEWIRQFVSLPERAIFRLYYQAALDSLPNHSLPSENEAMEGNNDDNRGFYIAQGRNGLIMSIHFDGISIFTLLGELSERELHAVISPTKTNACCLALEQRERAEIHAEPSHVPFLLRELSRSRQNGQIQFLTDELLHYQLNLPAISLQSSHAVQEKTNAHAFDRDVKCRQLSMKDFDAVKGFFATYNPESSIFSSWMLEETMLVGLFIDVEEEEGRQPRREGHQISKLKEMLDHTKEKTEAEKETTGKLVATGGVIVWSPELRICNLGNFLTAPPYRGRGYALRLARDLLSRLQSKGYHTFTLATYGANEPANRLYSSLGFRVVERRTQIDLWKN